MPWETVSFNLISILMKWADIICHCHNITRWEFCNDFYLYLNALMCLTREMRQSHKVWNVLTGTLIWGLCTPCVCVFDVVHSVVVQAQHGAAGCTVWKRWHF